MRYKLSKRELVYILIPLLLISLMVVPVAILEAQSRGIEAQFLALLESRGVPASQVVSITAAHSYFNQYVLGTAPWVIKVTYADEPGIYYSYRYADGNYTDGGAGGDYAILESYRPLKHYLAG